MDRDSSSNFQHFQENGQNVTSSTGQTTALTSAAVNPENQLKNCGAADCQVSQLHDVSFKIFMKLCNFITISRILVGIV